MNELIDKLNRRERELLVMASQYPDTFADAVDDSYVLEYQQMDNLFTSDLRLTALGEVIASALRRSRVTRPSRIN